MLPAIEVFLLLHKAPVLAVESSGDHVQEEFYRNFQRILNRLNRYVALELQASKDLIFADFAPSILDDGLRFNWQAWQKTWL